MNVHRADPKERQRILWVVLGFCALGIVGALAFRWVLGRIDTHLAANEAMEAVRWARVLASALIVLTVTSFLGLAGYLWQQARRVRADGRWPPRTTRTLRNVPVLTGAAALARARRLEIGSILVLLGGLGTLYYVIHLVRLLFF